MVDVKEILLALSKEAHVKYMYSDPEYQVPLEQARNEKKNLFLAPGNDSAFKVTLNEGTVGGSLLRELLDGDVTIRCTPSFNALMLELVRNRDLNEAEEDAAFLAADLYEFCDDHCDELLQVIQHTCNLRLELERTSYDYILLPLRLALLLLDNTAKEERSVFWSQMDKAWRSVGHIFTEDERKEITNIIYWGASD